MKKLPLVLGALLIILLVGLMVFAFIHHTNTANQSPNQPTPSPAPQPTTKSLPTPSSHDLSEAIEDDDNPGATYQINNVTQPQPGWFIVAATMKNNYGSFDQISVVQEQSNGTLNVIVGPGTSFPESYLKLQRIPQAVADKLPVYNDD